MVRGNAQPFAMFGERLSVERAGTDLKLVIRPDHAAAKRVVGLLLGFSPFLVIVAAVVFNVHRAVLQSFRGTGNINQVTPSIFLWCFALFVAVFVAVGATHFSKPVKIRFRSGLKGRLARAASRATGTDPDGLVSIEVKRGGSSSSYLTSAESLFNFRVQQDGVEEIPSGEHVTASRSGGDWWLRFETSNYEPWCINLPIPDASTREFADVFGEALGVECIVVHRIEASPTQVTPEET